MIIDFSVKNFRSFKEEQKISFVAGNYDKTLPGNLLDPHLSEKSGADLRLLRAVALYGPNGAGKTNVLHALRFLAHMVENSASNLDEGDPTGVEPFALDAATPEEPTEFVLRFIVDGVRYHYILVLNRTRVLYETMSSFPKGSARTWFERGWDDDSEAYSWGPIKPVEYKRDTTREKFTRSNTLYLSQAVKLNDEQLRPVYLWFKERVQFLRLSADFPPLSPAFTVQAMMEHPNRRAQITRLLQHADFGILSAKASERPIRRDDLPLGMPEELVSQILQGKHFEIKMGHRGTEGREFPLDWGDQSSGTQKFFALAGPWLDILKNGYFAGLDEIESSMHPTMVRELLRLAFSDESNPRGAQILFTTHNPLLLDTQLLRRDQVWFADKDDEGATHLYPLTDYSPRNKESLIRGYMAGRYGAIPFIPEGLLGKAEAPTNAE
jgi:uncharacterized protein